MRLDSASHMQMRVIIDFYCPVSSGPASASLTDGHPDVFLPASYLRDLLRREMFIKTTPVHLAVWECVCVRVKYLSASHKQPLGECTALLPLLCHIGSGWLVTAASVFTSGNKRTNINAVAFINFTCSLQRFFSGRARLSHSCRIASTINWPKKQALKT